MAATRTPGITIDAAGCFITDEFHRGTRISLRLGQTTLDKAESRLRGAGSAVQAPSGAPAALALFSVKTGLRDSDVAG